MSLNSTWLLGPFSGGGLGLEMSLNSTWLLGPFSGGGLGLQNLF